MPIEYTLSDVGSFVHVKVTGSLTTNTLIDYLENLGSNPQLNRDHVTLFDATEITIGDISIQDRDFDATIILSKIKPSNLVARKLAIVIGDNRLLPFAQGYQVRSHAMGETTKIFFDLTEARAWLAL